MDVQKLFSSCKRGDLPSVKYLVEKKRINLYIRDIWNSTPLYYACLCGHVNVVEYLLSRGAKCQMETFDFERCWHGALNARTRDVLRFYQGVFKRRDITHIKPMYMKRNTIQEFLRKLLDRGNYEDISFEVNDGEIFTAHRCILAVRSNYFKEMLQKEWNNKTTVSLKRQLVGSKTFGAILQYLYTGSVDILAYKVQDVMRMAKQWQLTDLMRIINDSLNKPGLIVSVKPGTNEEVVSFESGDENVQLHNDLGQLAERAIPNLNINWDICSKAPIRVEDHKEPFYADICISVEGYDFYCHKIFLCCRSDYFNALLTDHFSESETDSKEKIPVMVLQDVSALVFSKVVQYLYTEKPQISPQEAYDVMCVADRYLLPGLKRISANVIAENLDEYNVVPVLKASRIFGVPWLEGQCAKFMAKIFFKIVHTKEFADLIRGDIVSAKRRETDRDAIMIVDDIRFRITGSVQTYSDMEEENEKLNMLDNLLIQLGVEFG
ncbi:ankyrin repeat and BTB/POZ domain-containing protein 1-like [Glandiceps talaboti]